MKKVVLISIIIIAIALVCALIFSYGQQPSKEITEIYEEIQEQATDKGTTGDYVMSAEPIYENSIRIDSDSKAKLIFNNDLASIVNMTEQALLLRVCRRVPNSDTPACYNVNESFPSIRVSCIENNLIMYDTIKFERRSYERDGKRFGSYWYGEFNEEKYTFTVPVVPKGKEWKELNGSIYYPTITCKDPSEQVVSGSLCSSGTIKTWKINPHRLLYIMDSNGTIYFAGGYCRI